ncbi:uncharacterized protein LOC110009441 [Jatropha curcas]|uniref:uncharacterized protein LOC110009441 n=1 Tax=Jatropha curcas TaxID=180498 RepID=UPI0018937AC1|nr:uncharacterized protein LOC110009441 [Jatropha curcas]
MRYVGIYINVGKKYRKFSSQFREKMVGRRLLIVSIIVLFLSSFSFETVLANRSKIPIPRKKNGETGRHESLKENKILSRASFSRPEWMVKIMQTLRKTKLLLTGAHRHLPVTIFAITLAAVQSGKYPNGLQES